MDQRSIPFDDRTLAVPFFSLPDVLLAGKKQLGIVSIIIDRGKLLRHSRMQLCRETMLFRHASSGPLVCTTCCESRKSGERASSQRQSGEMRRKKNTQRSTAASPPFSFSDFPGCQFCGLKPNSAGSTATAANRGPKLHFHHNRARASRPRCQADMERAVHFRTMTLPAVCVRSSAPCPPLSDVRPETLIAIAVVGLATLLENSILPLYLCIVAC